ncbi:YkgJ family cysteine cluster protein [Chondromyces apiculatus]|uniref:YkgJ family cysteine cluster protein n=1 Tax=Chondromyces apiculatus TaxID=51 RepID=UPI0035214DBD
MQDEARWLADLAEIYRDADEAFSGWSCPASTECCRFGITGREPYVTSIELAAVRRALAKRGGARSFRHAAPLASGDAAPQPSTGGPRRLPVTERTCPMLTEQGRCAIYADRPLGCRTFFCHQAEPGTPVRHRDLLALVRRIQELAARHQPGGDQGRPLTRALQGGG